MTVERESSSAMAVVFISDSTRSCLFSCPVAKSVAHERNSVSRSAAFLERANFKCFKYELRKAGIGRSKKRRGDVESLLVRAERQSNERAAGDSFDSVDISVFRFTLGIPGFDDSDLPRVVGFLFGGLIILNHAFSLNSITPALLRSEAVGLFLAAVSISLPAISRQLNGGNSSTASKLGQNQVFALAEDMRDAQRQELAWSSYVLLRNTESTACLIWYGGKVVCARGFWEIPSVDSPDAKSCSLVWLEERLKFKRFPQLQEPLYVSSNADGQELEIVPRGTGSLLLQPFPQAPNSEEGSTTNQAFLLVISNSPQSYRKKDRIWIAAIAKKLSQVLS